MLVLRVEVFQSTYKDNSEMRFMTLHLRKTTKISLWGSCAPIGSSVNPYPYHIRWTLGKMMYELRLSKLVLISQVISLNELLQVEHTWHYRYRYAWQLQAHTVFYKMHLVSPLASIADGFSVQTLPCRKSSQPSFQHNHRLSEAHSAFSCSPAGLPYHLRYEWMCKNFQEVSHLPKAYFGLA